MPYTILIADDSPYIREALCNVFEREEEFDVCGEAENGREAVEKAQELHPDLILLDLSMPVMNGLDATRVLKQMMPEVPVIMFSAYSGSSTEKEARAVGASALSQSLSTSLSCSARRARARTPTITRVPATLRQQASVVRSVLFTFSTNWRLRNDARF
jgi:DNA-binding NarL/FixJ family response regulator